MQKQKHLIDGFFITFGQLENLVIQGIASVIEQDHYFFLKNLDLYL